MNSRRKKIHVTTRQNYDAISFIELYVLRRERER